MTPLVGAGIAIFLMECVFQALVFTCKLLTVAERRWRNVEKDGQTSYGVLHRYGFELVRGVLERTLLTVGLLSGVPQVLIPFGVLKLQNRIGLERDGEDDRKEAARAYFLMGNFLTILFSIAYAQALSRIGHVSISLFS